MDQIRGHCVPPVHVSPTGAIGIVLEEQMVFVVVEDQPVGIVVPATERSKVDLCPFSLGVRRRIQQELGLAGKLVEGCLIGLRWQPVNVKFEVFALVRGEVDGCVPVGLVRYRHGERFQVFLKIQVGRACREPLRTRRQQVRLVSLERKLDVVQGSLGFVSVATMWSMLMCPQPPVRESTISI